jgi:hypothetical protein
VKEQVEDTEKRTERIRNAVGLSQWRDIETGELRIGGRLFAGENVERASQIVEALEGLTIREAQDLLERVKIHLLNSIISPDS